MGTQVCLWDASPLPHDWTGVLTRAGGCRQVACFPSAEDKSTAPSGHPVWGGEVKHGLVTIEWKQGSSPHAQVCNTFPFFPGELNLPQVVRRRGLRLG